MVQQGYLFDTFREYLRFVCFLRTPPRFLQGVYYHCNYTFSGVGSAVGSEIDTTGAIPNDN